MKVLVINAGSSSLKYQLMDPETGKVFAKGLCERIGLDGKFTYKPQVEGKETIKAADVAMPTHSEAIQTVLNALVDPQNGVISSMKEIDAVGHRVVHGGETFASSVLINDEVLKAVEDCTPLAPLHNPANIIGIEACRKVLGDDVPQVAVFDTAFHQTMPEHAYLYSIPYKYYENDKLRRYGFHGTSHRFVSKRVAELMGKDIKDLKIITCHRGNGASLAAVQGGVSVDTTMGFTPLDGFIMGTRSGTLDPSVVTFIAEKDGLSPSQMSELLNKKSGVLGISGVSNDNRDVCEAAAQGNERAKLAVEMQNYQIIKYIGGYIAAMNGVDAIAFTGGIGENNYDIREAVCDSFTYMGLELDREYNYEHSHIRGEDLKISTDRSKVAVFAVSTDEELVIARDTLALIS